VEEEHRGAARCLEAGFEHMHPETVDVVHEAGADAGREHRRTVGHRLGDGRRGGLGGTGAGTRVGGQRGRRHHRNEALHQPAACERATVQQSDEVID
jgi:hypothetical protein